MGLPTRLLAPIAGWWIVLGMPMWRIWGSSKTSAIVLIGAFGISLASSRGGHERPGLAAKFSRREYRRSRRAARCDAAARRSADRRSDDRAPRREAAPPRPYYDRTNGP